MEFIADLHIHSRFSRATSRTLDLKSLDRAAQQKGLAVIGAGDMTHPVWLDELEEQLVEAEEGLFRLSPDLGGGPTRFLLTGEISSIYKKDGRVRKVHSLILMPGFEAARKLAEKLDRLGNIKSDGRPILGLDAKDLLEICLEASADCFFIPAHIWTPWFSLLGSKSGFDSVEECFGDLTGHIRALETGLSSDPPMNWRLSQLDGYVLVSNSDAHSAEKLGREANLFDVDLSYPAMVRAMSGNGGFEGTLEFFPEEGKYHLDGHRKCGRRLDPEETRRLGGLCPECGRPVTVGVLARVLDLADRPEGARPEGAAPFHSLIPLAEVLSEIIGVGPKSKKVGLALSDLLEKVGPELFILRQAPLEDVERVGGPLLSEALKRMRAGRVTAEGGYDGEYGRISLFAPGELAGLSGQKGFFKTDRPQRAQTTRAARTKKSPAAALVPAPLLSLGDPLLDDLNPEQRRAASHPAGPLAVTAGPGTGKTLVLTRRAAWLVREGLAEPENILGLTFTKAAAAEMSARLSGSLPFRQNLKNTPVMTFHALGLDLLAEHLGAAPKVLDEEERLEIARKAARDSGFKAPELVSLISLSKHRFQGPGDLDDPDLARAFGRYETHLAALGALDFDDLIVRPIALLEADQDWLAARRRRHSWLLVDEYQDINQAQYRLIRLLCPGPAPNLTVIGDPDQAIYGFRGADSAFFERFAQDFPQGAAVRLTRNYRSTDTILKASTQVIDRNPGGRRRMESGLKGPAKVTTSVLASPAAEAEYVVAKIEGLLGGASFFALDSGRADSASDSDLTLGDVAVLYRLHALATPVAEALARAGLPFQQAGSEPVRETDDLDFSAEKISLLTMHAAKGLEFEVVFVIGLEEGLLPYHPPGKEPALEEEERRLFFVALTRAKRRLFLTRSRRRTLFGRSSENSPSPFLDEIGPALKAADALPERKKKPRGEQMTLF